MSMGASRQNSGGLNPAAAAFPFPGPGASGPSGASSPNFRPAVSPGAYVPSPTPLSGSAGPFTPGGMRQQQQQPPVQPMFGQPTTPGSASMNGVPSGGLAVRPGRSGRRQPPQNQPIKISGHNSKPSVSLNPAAFAAAMAAAGAAGPDGKPKRKVVLHLPREGGQDADSEAAAEKARQKAKNDGAEEGVVEQKAAIAAASALIRSKWIARSPLSAEEYAAAEQSHDLQAVSLGIDAMQSRAQWPVEEMSYESIDIYLPGKQAWDAYRERRLEEKLQELGVSESPTELVPPWQGGSAGDGWGVGAGGGDGGAFGLPEPHYEEPQYTSDPMSISSPADPGVISSRLSNYLQSQADNVQDPPDAPPAAAVASTTRWSSNLPARLRDLAAMHLGTGTAKCSSSSPMHSQTMSLSMPQSGGPFGPGVLTALGLGKDVERAASDGEKPDEPALGSRPAMERGHSDGPPELARLAAQKRAASQNAIPPFGDSRVLDQVTEEAEESVSAVPTHTAGKASWQDLGRGFGYDPDEPEAEIETREEEPVELAPSAGTGHARNASKMSLGPDFEEAARRAQRYAEDVDMRTNPSEDGDMSNEDGVDELDELDAERLAARGEQGHLLDFAQDEQFSYDEDEEEDEDDLSDSRTPSGEEYSNPSDEEAAREARQQRRALRAELRAGRKIAKQRAREAKQHRSFQHSRHLTGDTLPSSSLGEGEPKNKNNNSGWGFDAHRAQAAARVHADQGILSNPSDEDERGTFGGSGPIDHIDSNLANGGDSRASQDFRYPHGPMDGSSAPDALAYRRTSAQSQFSSATLGRSALRSALNPSAKEFKFGASDNQPTQASAPAASSESALQAARDRAFRLPSIHNSSFGGSSAFENGEEGGPKKLSANAPSFTPGQFTFVAPGDAPKMHLPPQQVPNSAPADLDAEQYAELIRADQGRTKRPKFRGDTGPLDDHPDVNEPSSPARPIPSAASIEGPLRDQLGLGHSGPPPFNPNPATSAMSSLAHLHHAQEASAFTGLSAPTQGTFAFKPSVPAFMPTWAKGAAGFGTGAEATQLRRPGIPDFAPPGSRPAQEAHQNGQSTQPLGGVPSSDFTFKVQSKAIPIRRPEEVDPHRLGESLAQQDERSASEQEVEDEPRAKRRQPPSATQWARDSRFNDLQTYGRSPPVAVPTGGLHRAQQQAAAGRRSHQRRDSASSLAQSIDRHHRVARAAQGAADPDDVSLDDDEEDEDDDGMIDDIVDELGDRLKREIASEMEAWAGKILDEVTIMGQVRPAPNLDRHAIMDVVSQQMEHSFSVWLDRFKDETAFLQKAQNTPQRLTIEAAPDPDDSSATIKASETRDAPASSTAPPSAHSFGHGPLDAQGELDFDFVQEVLDAKIATLHRDLAASFESAIPRAIAAIPAPRLVAPPVPVQSAPAPAGDASPKAVDLTPEATETLSMLLIGRLQPVLEGIEGVFDAKRRQELIHTLEPLLEDHLVKSQVKASSERQDMQGTFEAVIDSRVTGWEKQLADARDGMEHLQVTLINNLIPHLETLRMDSTSVADLTLERLAPLVSSLKSEPFDTDAIVRHVADVVGKQSLERMDVDLSPVIALIEPIVAHQRRIMENQRETQISISDVPAAINNAKASISASITDRLEEVVVHIKQTSEKAEKLNADRDGFMRELDDSRREATERKAEADELRAELVASQGYISTMKEEIVRLESRLEDESMARERAHDAERVAEEAKSLARQAEIARDADAALNEELRTHVEELRSERAREQESSKQAIAEALKRATEAGERATAAEKAMKEAAEKVEARVDDALRSERAAQERAEKAVEKAAKAEGEIAALEKITSEQESKLGNMHQLSAKQKQNAAQAAKDLSNANNRLREADEAEKRLRATETVSASR
ncbi:hypothetical protein IE81DRAFT_231806 [Ceraceosorus guamensis]|uniref:Uncharacterized protein n=1 Tax=Ceraceosorus guamensis TaxID=1522189 RepID=A0A316VRX6_9BASI|nr:hypothetical protein IE81DRAFT_231806 [Ceraceosorus guamensis]PWN40356.1 hypothetical protein IE81DRAFT_231806 [Ceraceosorus guamensis]